MTTAKEQNATPLIPPADRPIMPEGYEVPETTEGTLPWSSIQERMATARSYWICTTRPDGRPHAVPAWGAWLDDTFYFDAPPGTRRQRNLSANPAVTIHLESGDQAVILEGIAMPLTVPDPAAFARIADAYEAKYPYRPESADGMYTLRIRTAFAWENFPKDATRWRFPTGNE